MNVPIEYLEQLWDLYTAVCKEGNLTPRFKDFLVWIEENEFDPKQLR